MIRLSPLLLLLTFLAGCSTAYENTAVKSWDLMSRHETEEAVRFYEKSVTSDKDRLLKLMDEGILLRVGEKYEESNQRFFEAAKIIERNGYLSLGEQGLTLLTNEKQTTYQGEDFEKVLVHIYLGLNYLALHDDENAIVETRRVNEILFKMISEAKRPYELNAFAKYLNALLFENAHEENDAFVDYQDTLKIDPSLSTRFPVIREDLLRLSKKMGFEEEFDRFKAKFAKEDINKASRDLSLNAGSIVLLFENGKSPVKYSSREKHSTRGQKGNLIDVVLPVPYYQNRPFRIRSAEISVIGEGSSESAKTVVLNDIETTAVKHLKDRTGRMIAKALLTAATKAGLAYGVAKASGSEGLGLLTGLALGALSEADTRSWLLLPADLQIAKLYVKPGRYKIKISYEEAGGRAFSDEILDSVEVRPNRSTILQRRAFN